MDEDSVVFKKLERTTKYDQGTVTFRARRGKLIDLDKLHESIWATRLSGGTRSGLVSLEVTAVGEVAESADKILLKVAGSSAEFVLAEHPEREHRSAFAALRAAAGAGRQFRVTGRIDQYQGRWPDVLRNKPQKPRRILVTDLQPVAETEEQP